MIIQKIELDKFIDMLEDIYNNGANYIDIDCVEVQGDIVTSINIVVKNAYINYKNDGESLTDDDINFLIQ